MNSACRLFPAIVWVGDDFASMRVVAWHKNLSDKAKVFVNLAKSPDEVWELVDHYQQQSFDKEMLDAGLSLEPHVPGRRINIVFLAEVGKGKPAPNWAAIEEVIKEVRGRTFSTESHRILLITGAHPEDWGKVLAEIGNTPWLLTDTITGGFKLDDRALTNLCGQLLEALVLTEKEGAPTGGPVITAFYQQDVHPGHLRLAGFSRLDLSELMARITRTLARVALRRSYLAVPDYARTRDFEKHLTERVERCLKGQFPAEKVIDFISGPEGMGGWSAVDILHEGSPILDRRMRQATHEANFVPSLSVFGLLKQRLRRLMVRLRLVRPLPTASSQERDYLLAALERLRDLVKNLVEIAQKDFPVYQDIPNDFIKGWIRELEELMGYALRHYWQELDILREMPSRLETAVAENFNAALHDWGLDEPFVREVANSLRNGNLLRFSARMMAKQPVHANALVTSLQVGNTLRHGTRVIPSVTLRVWSGQPPLLLASSTPIQPQLLQPQIGRE